MDWTDRLQQRYGYLGIPGLGRYLVGLQILCFAVSMAQPGLVGALALDPARVAQGEWWRLATFLFVPSLTPFNVFFAVFFFMFQWTVFEGLESAWGPFKMTLYCLLGWLCALALPMAIWAAGWIAVPTSGGLWSVSIELAFAYVYPDYTLYIYFILPMKMRWMAWLLGLFLLYQIFSQGAFEALSISVGLLNYLLFFAPGYARQARLRSQAAAGRRAFEAARREAERATPRSCARCGAGPDRYLRLCTCPHCGPDGRMWCENHLDGHLAEGSGGQGATVASGAPSGATGPGPTANTPGRRKAALSPALRSGGRRRKGV